MVVHLYKLCYALSLIPSISHTHIQGSSFLLLFGNLKSSCHLQWSQRVVYVAFHICYSSSVDCLILSLFHHSLKEEICRTIEPQRNTTKLLYIRRCNSKKKNISRNIYHISETFAHFIKSIYIYTHIRVCVCVCMCMHVCVHIASFTEKFKILH